MENYRKVKSEMTKKVYDVLVNNNIKCFLTGGSLLGAYRDGGELPADNYPGGNFNVVADEIQKNYKKLKRDFIDLGFRPVRGSENRTFTIFVKSKIKSEKTKIQCELIGYEKNGDMYERKAKFLKVIPSEFFEKQFKKVIFLDYKYPAPHDIEKYLEWLYIEWKVKNNSTKEKNLKNSNHIRPRK